MKLHSPFRIYRNATLVVLIAASPSYVPIFGQKAPASPPKQSRTAPPPRIESSLPVRPQPTVTNRPVASALPGSPLRQQHLEQWMENHKHLSLPQQQLALQNEPGFSELPPQVQQSQMNTLGHLYTMDPQQRSRMLNRVERLERLSPQQQQQWDHAVQGLNGIPAPRRRLMTRAIIDLREMPSNQRQQVIDSPAFGAQFSPDERQTISTVLTAY